MSRTTSDDDEEDAAASAPRGSSSNSTRGSKDTSKAGTGSSGDIDVSKALYVEFLNANEVSLCEKLGLLPLHFLAIKEALVREAFRNGLLSREGVKRVLKVAIITLS